MKEKEYWIKVLQKIISVIKYLFQGRGQGILGPRAMSTLSPLPFTYPQKIKNKKTYEIIEPGFKLQ